MSKWFGRVAAEPDWPLGAGAALGLLAMGEVVSRRIGVRTDSAELSIALLVALATTAPLGFVRTHPLPVATIITAADLVSLTIVHRVVVIGVAAHLVALYVLGIMGYRRWALVFIAPLFLYAVAPFTAGASDKLFTLLLVALALTAAGIGIVRSARRERAERHASQQAIADTLLEHAARGERARIARELHDVVAHHISMIAVQVETARLTTAGMPPEGVKRLVAIGDTARTALTEMRRLLGVLREDSGTEPTRQPQPGLVQLNELIDEARESTGSSTRLIVRGHVVPLDPGIELTAYRIVQEALTNVRRHAPGAAVDVELDYAEDALRVRVRDNGPARPEQPAEPEGHGLVGMRERAAMVGGRLWTGPAPGSGFLVTAVLPRVAG